jgi:hypothetical protein
MTPRFLTMCVMGALALGSLAQDVRAGCGDYVLIGDESESALNDSALNDSALNDMDEMSTHEPTRPCHGPNCESNNSRPLPGMPVSFEVLVVEPGCFFQTKLELLDLGESRYPQRLSAILASGHPDRVVRPPRA